MQKAIRRSHVDDAAYWAMELLPRYPHHLWRRLMTILSEDVGIAAPPGMVADIEALHSMFERQREEKRGDGAMPTMHAVILLARSKKSRLVNHALIVHGSAETYREPPDYALDRHTKRGRELGRGYDHFWDEAALLADPETGELSPEGALSDPYLERARSALEGER